MPKRSPQALRSLSPFFTLVTPRPISTTTPAPSWPRIAGNSPSGSAPDSVNSSVWQKPVALISTSTSPSRGPSSWTVDISSGRPAATATAARTSMSSSLFLDFRYVIPGRRTRAFRDCRIAYVQAIRAANEQGLRKFSRARGAGDFCRALEYRLHRHQIRAAQRRAADLSHNPHGFGGGADGNHRRDRSAAMAGSRRLRPQRRCGHCGAWILSGRARDRDRAFDPRRALGADPRSAAHPDLDPGEPLARRTRHAAAMGRALARARRRGADPARSTDERGGGLGLAGLGRVAGQHHLGHAVPEALLRQDRLACRQSRAVRRGDDFLRRRRMAVRERCGALDRRVRPVTDLARGGIVDRVDRTVVLADPTLGGHLGGQPVLSGAGGDRGDGLRPVRRTARWNRDSGHDRLVRRGVSGQPARVAATRLKSRNKNLRALVRRFLHAAREARIPQRWIPVCDQNTRKLESSALRLLGLLLLFGGFLGSLLDVLVG